MSGVFACAAAVFAVLWAFTAWFYRRDFLELCASQERYKNLWHEMTAARDELFDVNQGCHRAIDATISKHKDVLAECDALKAKLNSQASASAMWEQKHSEAVAKVEGLEQLLAADREWKAAAVLKLAMFELAKKELLDNLATPFRKRKTWSSMVEKLFRTEPEEAGEGHSS